MPDTKVFPHGAILVGENGLQPLLGTESVVHFIIPMPTPVDVPDGWKITTFLPLTGEELAELPAGTPQQRLGCEVQFFHERSPMSLPQVDMSVGVLRRRVVGDETIPATNGTIPVTEHWTYAHLMMPAPGNQDSDAMMDLLEDGLGELRQVQIALWLTTGRHSPLVAIETLPLAIAMLIRRLDVSPVECGRSVGIFLVTAPWKLRHSEPPAPVDGGEGVAQALNQLAQSPQFYSHRRFELAAKNQMSTGDYHAAVLSAATSAEHMLDHVLCSLLWEEAVTPEDATSVFVPNRHRSLDQMLAQELPRRIGGDWDASGSGFIANWSTRIREVRNAAIHRSVEPTRRQAAAAVTSLEELSHGVGDLLRQPANAERYPRTAHLYAPTARATAIASLVRDPREPHWVTTLSRWMRERDVAVRARKGWPISAADGDARLVAVTGPTGLRWTVWRPGDLVAVPVSPPEHLSREVYRSIERSRGAADWNLTIFAGDAPPVQVPPITLRPRGLWQLQHNLIPGCGVMVDPDLDLRPLRNPTRGREPA